LAEDRRVQFAVGTFEEGWAAGPIKGSAAR
jgi:hypothetical protein